MVGEVNEFGKRGVESDSAASGSSPKRRNLHGGLHRFASSQASASGEDALVEDGRSVAKGRLKEFVAASVGLRGAIAFDSAFEDRSSSGQYAGMCKFYRAEFNEAFSKAIEITSDLDERGQRLLVEMACNTKKVIDSGDVIDAAFKHLDEFDTGPRSTLLLHAIGFFPELPGDARVRTSLNLSKALAKGYLENAHEEKLKSMSAAGSNLQPGAKTYFRSLLSQFGPTEKTLSPLEQLPSEILRNIVIRTVEDDLHEDNLEGFEAAGRTIAVVGSLNRNLDATVRSTGLFDLNSKTKSTRSNALERYDNFMNASKIVTAAEADPNLDPNNLVYQESVAALGAATKDVISSVRFLGEDEQSAMISEFCKHSNAQDMAFTMIAASEHAADFFPEPRSQMLFNVIQLISSAPDTSFVKRACEQLANAARAGYLEQQHVDAIKITDLVAVENLAASIRFHIKRLDAASLPDSNRTAAPPATALFEKDGVALVNRARRDLMKQVDDRVAGDRNPNSSR